MTDKASEEYSRRLVAHAARLDKAAADLRAAVAGRAILRAAVIAGIRAMIATAPIGPSRVVLDSALRGIESLP